MDGNPHVDALRKMQKFFNTAIDVFTEDDSLFRATDGTKTVAGQVAHTAQTIDWFLEGGFFDKGFRTDFEAMEKEVQEITSLEKAKKWFDESVDSFCKHLESIGEEGVMEPLPENEFFGTAPRIVMVQFTVEHTAHHRGSLAVYARLIGKTPKMPYGEE